MKRKLLSLLFACGLFVGSQAQTLLYSNDFESGLNGATIVGNGILTASGNVNHGQVFHNAAGGQAIRTNYLLLPNNIFADLQASGVKGATISFWVNKGTATGYYWSPIFTAYGAAPNPANTWPMLALQTRGWAQINNAGWCDFTNAQNVKGTNTESTAWTDDGNWHFYTATFTETNVKVYIDGAIMNEWNVDGVSTGQVVSGLFNNGSALTYICLGGNQAWNWNDPDPAFMFDKVKIYAGALTAAQINSLKTTDQLSAPVLTANPTAIFFDDQYLTESLIVNGGNLSAPISITAPAGITVNPTSLPVNPTNETVSVTYDGTSVVNGNISLTSGSTTTLVPVKSASNVGCFTPLYNDRTNLITDPYCNRLSNFSGWGARSIETSYVYCGSRSIKVSGRCGGSLDFSLNGKIEPNKTYRVKAMISTNGTGEVKIGISGAADALVTQPISTAAGEWLPLVFNFKTGSTLNNPLMYFNSCESQTATVMYIDNWEMYDVTDIVAGINITTSHNQKVYNSGKNLIAEFSLNNPSDVTVTVFDLQGKSISQISKHFESGIIKHEIDVQLPNGVYIVQLSSNEFINKHKLIIR